MNVLALRGHIAAHLRDSRHGLNTQFRLPDLLRQSVYSRLAGYEDLNDAQRLSTDPTFRLIGSPTRWDRSAALRTLTEITLLCAERPKPQKTGSAWMHLATLYRSLS